MESYGTELKETPYPLIAALGARELQAKVLSFVRTINEEFVPKLHFTSLPIEHRFPVKKEVREKHGTFPNQTQRDFDGYRVQGILKTKWLKKHHELLPAVVLLFHEFDPRWNQRDWLTHEATIKDEMDQLKKTLVGRECRVLLLLVQQIDDAGVAPVNVTDERLASLRRRLETDSKTLVLLRSRDLVRGSAVLSKLESSIRNYALEYYKAQAKRVKRYKKALTKTSLLPLHVRFSFKIAHYYEFRRYTTKVLQHYEAAYRAVVQLPLTHDAAAAINDKSDSGTELGFCQVKTMAEYINFKLCYHLVFSSNNIKAAVEQLHRHMKVYARAMGPAERVFEHWEWVARQYHVFAQLLAEAVSIRGSLPSTGLDSDVYKEPYLYFSIAAKYASYRRRSAAKLGLADPDAVGSSTTGKPDESSHSEFKIVPSAFVGGDPVVSEAAHAEPSYGAFVKYRYAEERATPHAKKTIHLLEQAIHHVALYVADQKVPRSRLKTRFLVALGMERLACNDFDRARAELQRAKLLYGGEQWWSQTTQILRLVLTCTFHQADTAAFIDTSLQLLSPVLAEFVPHTERLRVQESFELAWKDPTTLGPPFAESSLMSYEMPLDATRALIAVEAHFDRVYACVREDVVLCMQLDSHFPAAITMAKIELLFSDERYDMVVYHRDAAASDTIEKDESDGKWYASLAFDPTMAKQFQIPLRVLEGRTMLRYRETRFHFGSEQGRVNMVDGSVSDEQYLTFVLPHDNTASSATSSSTTSSNSLSSSSARRASRPFLMDGRVPVMGRGPGSPSFVRRKSMFSAAEVGRSQELDGGDLVEEDGGAAALTRSSALAILQPRPRATLEIVTKHALLAGDFRVISFLLKSKEDTLKNTTFRVTSEPAPASASPSDVLFYCEDATAPGNLVPVALDGTTFQPRDRTPIRDLEPHSEEPFSVIVRSTRAATLRLAVHVTYSTKSGVQVSLEERYELLCRDPFRLSSGFVHDFPNGVGVFSSSSSSSSSPSDPNTPTKQSHAVVGKAVNLHGVLQCSAHEPLRIVSMQFEPSHESSSSLASDGMVASGFGTWPEEDSQTRDECQVMREGDTRGVCLRLLPTQVASSVALGSVQIQWRRLSSVVPTSHAQRNDLVTTSLAISSVAFVEAPLNIALHTPPFGVEGALLTLEICVRNNENAFHSVRIKPFDESGDFMISGRTNVVEDLLPLDQHVFRIGLIPTKSGYLRLPQLEITSVTHNLPFANSNDRHEVFVFPRESAQWQAQCQPEKAATDTPSATMAVMP